MLSETYRPQTFNDIIGHTEAKTILQTYLEENPRGRSVLISGSPGIGKCHGVDTPILMFDGHVKMVQDIQVGDVVMGDDSTPRNVLSLGYGRDMLYDVISNRGESYRVNGAHILCLKQSGRGEIHKRTYVKGNIAYKAICFNSDTKKLFSKTFQRLEDAEIYLDSFTKSDNITEISVEDYLQLSKGTYAGWLKGYKKGVEFHSNHVGFDPYILGLWLGDGSSSTTRISSQDSEIIKYLLKTLPSYGLMMNYVSKYDYTILGIDRRINPMLNFLKYHNLLNNKHIPHCYKINDKNIRMQILAGLIDTDGHYAPNSGVFEIIQKNKRLMDDIVFLARSLGFCTSSSTCKKSCMYKGEKREGEYVRTIISGDIDSIPVRIKRKRADVRSQKKDHLVYGFTIREVGIGDYYGFSLDGNHRYLLGDFSVTHNTTMALAAARTFEYEPLEINASRSLRSHEDVTSLRDSCMAPVSFTSILKYAKPRKTCVILDEIDGSDPHAQRKVLEWIRDPKRVVPIICTSNEIPVIFKRAPEHITLHRCMPLNARDIYENLQAHAPMEFAEFQKIVKECQHDVRRLMNRFQYGQSDTLQQIPLTGDTIADLFKHQETFYGVSPTYWDL